MEASLDASLVKYKSKNLYFKGSTWCDIRDRLSVTKIDSKNLRERERERERDENERRLSTSPQRPRKSRRVRESESTAL